MAIYRLDVERRFGQLRFRLYEQGGPPGEMSEGAPDMKALLDALDLALAPLDTKGGVDSIIFRQIEYTKKLHLRETVRLSRL